MEGRGGEAINKKKQGKVLNGRKRNSYYPNIMFIYLINLMCFPTTNDDYLLSLGFSPSLIYHGHAKRDERKGKKLFELNHKNVSV